MDNDELKNKKSEFLPHLIILAAFFFLLSQTWLKWGSLVIGRGAIQAASAWTAWARPISAPSLVT